MVGIFHNVAGLFRAARPEVDRVHQFTAGFLRPFSEFMQPDFIGFGREPGEVQPSGTFFNRADAVLPVKPGDEVPARVANDRHAEFPHGCQDVFAEAHLIGFRVPGFINTAVHGTAEVFNKGTIDPLVDPADLIIFVKDH